MRCCKFGFIIKQNIHYRRLKTKEKQNLETVNDKLSKTTEKLIKLIKQSKHSDIVPIKGNVRNTKSSMG